jgi:HK97 gp10 family phage protein
MISAKFKKKFDIKGKIEDMYAEMNSHSIRSVQEGTLLIHKIAVESIQDNSSGTPVVRYNRAGNKRNVLASHPGEPPNTDTGRLAQSIKFDFKNGGTIGRVGTNLAYGRYLEFGTRRISARPWLSAAVTEASKEIGQIFKRNVREAINSIGKK